MLKINNRYMEKETTQKGSKMHVGNEAKEAIKQRMRETKKGTEQTSERASEQANKQVSSEGDKQAGKGGGNEVGEQTSKQQKNKQARKSSLNKQELRKCSKATVLSYVVFFLITFCYKYTIPY